MTGEDLLDWAEMHGYTSFRCPRCHKQGWTDTTPECSHCGWSEHGEDDDGPAQGTTDDD